MSYKVCPICGTPAHSNAALCSTCGTTLANVEVVKRETQPASQQHDYDRRYGEADLLEGEVRRRGQVFLFSAGLVITLLLCSFGFLYVGTRLIGNVPDTPTPDSPAFPDQPNATEAPMATNTTRPTMILPTVTPAPPTATFTPTEGPCTRQVQAGDNVISLAFSCGHRSQDVLPLILEMNNLSAPEQLQAGQTLLIPWPTPIVDESVTPDEEAAEVEGAAEVNEQAAEGIADSSLPDESLDVAFQPGVPTPFPTATLMPGVGWHVVQPDESMAGIAYQYNTRAETLSQLNPEIAFSLCDFRHDSGGDRCNVMLQVGQRVRVPVPLPTETLTPTLSGSETPTPTATPTFNAPSALTPGNRAMFGRSDLITLRWVGSGTLNTGEAYRITVENLTTETVHTADTSELFYIIPGAWQGQDARRHQYRWTVSVIRLDDPENPTYTTDARLFSWEGRGES